MTRKRRLRNVMYRTRMKVDRKKRREGRGGGIEVVVVCNA